jgi:glycosyltransferase involved in cell wall biosynthesis
MRLVLELSKRLDVQEWERRATAGELPGRWPYGFHHLRAQHDVLVNDEPAIWTHGWPSVHGYDVARLHRRGRGWHGADAVVSWEELTSITFPLRRRGGRPALCTGVIWSTDAWDRTSGRGLESRMTKSLLSRMDLLWCLSEAQSEELSRHVSPRTRIETLPFGIDTDFYTPAPDEESTRPLVVSAGSDRDRDLDVLFEALQMVVQKRPDADVVVQSSTALRPPAGIRVIPKMAHTALRDLYRRSALVVLALVPNLHVSGMTVALEAMSTGRPIVCTATPGMSEYVIDGVTGSLVQQRSPQALASAVLALLADPSARAAMGRSGIDHVRSRHREDQMMQRLSTLVSQTVEGKA